MSHPYFLLVVVTYKPSEMTRFQYKSISINFCIIIKTAMKLTQKQFSFEDYHQISSNNLEEVNLCQRNQLDQKQFNDTGLNKTELPQDQQIEPGYWRTNLMLQGSLGDDFPKTPVLKNVTSFQQKSMEDHGKRLKKSFENYIKFVSIKRCPQDQMLETKKIDFSDDDWVEQALNLVQGINMQCKNYLISFAKRSAEAEIFLKQVFLLIPFEYLDQFLLVIECIFEQYNTSKIVNLDEDQISAYASANCSTISQMARQKLGTQQVAPHDEQSQLQFEQMIKEWMEIVFLGLNGVFEYAEIRKSPLGNLDGIQTFCTSRKLIKLD